MRTGLSLGTRSVFCCFVLVYEGNEGLWCRLSAREITMRDWKFTRMMKQSGLQFTEKQLLKIVGGLGNKGQWKQALSAVEWVYNDKENKRYKSR